MRAIKVNESLDFMSVIAQKKKIWAAVDAKLEQYVREKDGRKFYELNFRKFEELVNDCARMILKKYPNLTPMRYSDTPNLTHGYGGSRCEYFRAFEDENEKQLRLIIGWASNQRCSSSQQPYPLAVMVQCYGKVHIHYSAAPGHETSSDKVSGIEYPDTMKIELALSKFIARNFEKVIEK